MNEDPFSSSAETRLSGFFDWIRSNAISIILVLVLLAGSFFIYLYFQNKNEEKLTEAFEAYQNIIQSFNNEESTLENLMQQIDSAQLSIEKTVYETASDLLIAKKAFDEANLDLAKGKLVKIITTADNSNNPLHDIAVIRLGYILIQERNFDEAKKNLGSKLDFYEPKRLELLGDIASFEESYNSANTYYEEAIKATSDEGFIELMNIKLSLLPSS
ncbi:MAG: YfgM family protein [Gammaproteobacteria bacterium]|tara:strand:+ start:81 stop:728 length:648 start_codon:yes stop_codon:yes gene_type:complete